MLTLPHSCSRLRLISASLFYFYPQTIWRVIHLITWGQHQLEVAALGHQEHHDVIVSWNSLHPYKRVGSKRLRSSCIGIISYVQFDTSIKLTRPCQIELTSYPLGNLTWILLISALKGE